MNWLKKILKFKNQSEVVYNIYSAVVTEGERVVDEGRIDAIALYKDGKLSIEQWEIKGEYQVIKIKHRFSKKEVEIHTQSQSENKTYIFYATRSE